MAKKPLKHGLYEFEVSGHARFPLEMLSYDSCYPANASYAPTIEASLQSGGYRHIRTVKLRMALAYMQPSVKKWAASGWAVNPDSVKLI